MPAVTGVWVMRDATVTLETVEYANQVAKARLVPDTPIQQYRTLVPDGAISDIDSSTWTLELTGVQKWTTGGLALALNTAAGTQLTLVLTPKNGTGNATATCEVIAMPVPFGDEQGKFPTFEVTLPVVGSPVFGTVGA